MNWLHYIAEANLYLGVFYLAYCIFLSKETHYQLNRGYLLSTCVLAFTIPIIQLGFIMPVQYLVLDDAPLAVVAAPAFTWVDALLYAYITGVVFFAARFMLKLYQLKKLVDNNPVAKAGNYTLVSLRGANTAFSFFNYLFVGSNTNGQTLITRHELVHIRQKHSIDVVFVELIQIVSWFNPAVYLLQNSLKTVHEYVADEQTAAAETNTIAYATYLLNNAYGLSGPAMTHSFFNYNLLKKRITMLHQKRSGNLARLKYLIAAPLCMGLLYQSTFGFDKTYGLINIAPKAPVIVQADVADTVPNKKTAPVNVEPLLKEKLKGLNIQNSTKLKPTGTIISDGKTSEQVFVEDKNGKLIDFYSKKGQAIHAENLAKEKAREAEIRIKEDKNIPVASVEQLRNGKVKAVIPTSAEIRITDPQTELRMEETQTQSEIRIDEPATAKHTPQQQKVPPSPPLQKDKKERFDPNAPIPDVSKVKFPAPSTPPKPDVSKVKFPPPTPPLQHGKKEKNIDVTLTPPKPDVSKVKFPPPVVKPDPDRKN